MADRELRGEGSDALDRRRRPCHGDGLRPGHRIGPGTEQPVTPNAFDVTDTNRDGKITPEEYRARMVEVFFLLDRNKDGRLVKDEITLASETAFRAADRNGDGRLSIQEYLDARMTDFTAADRNRDGVLGRDETEGR